MLDSKGLNTTHNTNISDFHHVDQWAPSVAEGGTLNYARISIRYFWTTEIT